VNALKQWQLECPRGKLNLVFPNTVGNIETMRNVHGRMWVPLLLKCALINEGGKPRYNFHKLRHAAASLFIKHLGSPKRVQAIMGHASIRMTYDLYGHLFEDHDADREAMKKIEAAIVAA
jgi:integrase